MRQVKQKHGIAAAAHAGPFQVADRVSSVLTYRSSKPHAPSQRRARHCRACDQSRLGAAAGDGDNGFAAGFSKGRKRYSIANNNVRMRHTLLHSTHRRTMPLSLQPGSPPAAPACQAAAPGRPSGTPACPSQAACMLAPPCSMGGICVLVDGCVHCYVHRTASPSASFDEKARSPHQMLRLLQLPQPAAVHADRLKACMGAAACRGSFPLMLLSHRKPLSWRAAPRAPFSLKYGARKPTTSLHAVGGWVGK